MPGRQSHGRPLLKTAAAPAKKNNSRTTKRNLDAFSIASHQNPERYKIKQSRLGAAEGGERPGKRRRDEEDHDEDGEDEEQESKTKKQKKAPKGRFDELDIEEGSDSDGNEWKLGQVDSDDDSELDSDEAFGDSDAEKFDGYAFSGSTDKKRKKKVGREKEMNLDEEEEDSDSELEEGDLGEGAVDLATMLDMADEDSEMDNIEGQHHTKDNSDDAMGSEQSEDDADTEESDEDVSTSSTDDEEEVDAAEEAMAVNKLMNGLAQKDDTERRIRKGRNDNIYDELKSEKVSLSGFGAVPEPKRKKKDVAVKVPLAQRQQDRLNRSAAYEKTKETLSRWTDTVAHNRRADHLLFPLPDHEMEGAKMNKELVPTNLSKPFNELEATIQSILEESGLATANGKDDEDHLRKYEELETKKMSIEEVKARTAQLRMARELMFREEKKAKQIKKIKSKSYRRVHRKEREREDRKNQEALAEGGFEPSEDELEAQDRRRAEERMGSKHRGSKWAKAMKGTGRAAWDEDARSGITEMARKDEELRKRVEGRSYRKEFEDDSEESASDSGSNSDDDDDEAAARMRLLKKIEKTGSSKLDINAPGARLANMDFMLRADAVRKKENDDMVEEMRRELAGEDTPSEDEPETVGRRIFGPASTAVTKKAKDLNSNAFEEPTSSDVGGSDGELQFPLGNDSTKTPAESSQKKKSTRKPRVRKPGLAKTVEPEASTEGGAWSKVTSKNSTINEAEATRRRHRKNDAMDVEELDLSQAAIMAIQPEQKTNSKKKTKASTILELGSDPDSSDNENTIQLPFAIRDQELIKRAFAGADVVGDFEAEKKETMEEEDDKQIDNTLPGWGNWVGDGISEREKNRNKGRFVTKVKGVKAANRKDAKLDRVIINEKRVKKNDKYRTDMVPHGFENRQQYEWSLRAPLGPERTTKATFQEATKPRILLKQGIIAPMSKPLL